ncbi:DnaJ domain-containing protein [bacterium]|nr:DnaJ domain-containing protein [bacterium]
MKKSNDYPVAFLGNFSEVPPADVLYSLACQDETGVLDVRHDKVLKRIYFEGGRIVAVTSNLARDGLIRRFVEEGRTPDGLRLGELPTEDDEFFLPNFWAELGVMDAATLGMTLQQSSTAAIADVLRWKSADFAFRFDDTPPSAMVAWKREMDVGRVVFEGLVGAADSEALKIWVREYGDLVPELTLDINDLQQQYALGAGQLKMLRSLDLDTPLMDLAVASSLRLEEALALFWALYSLRCVRFPNDPALNIPKAPPKDPSESRGSAAEASELAMLLGRDGPELLTKPPFHLLQISRDSFTDDDIRRGYYALAQRYHVTGLINLLSPELQELSRNIFQRASNFFEALITWAKARSNKGFVIFDTLIEETLTGDLALANAEKHYLAGIDLQSKGKADEALMEFETAVDLRDFEAEYRAAAARVKLASADGEVSQVKAVLGLLQRANYLNRFDGATHSAMGECYERLGNINEAAGEYRLARACGASLGGDLAQAVARVKATSSGETAAGQVDTEEERERLAKVADYVDNLDEEDYFGILGLERDATASQVKKSYFSLAKDYHPDKFGRLKNHPTVVKAFVMINEAYNVLSDNEKRRTYERGLRNLQSIKQHEELEQRRQRSRLITKGKNMINEGKHEQAIDVFNSYLGKYEQNDRVKTYLAWAKYNRDIKSHPDARGTSERELLDLSKSDGANDEAWYFLGMISAKAEDYKRAMMYFRKAIDANPDNHEASRELRLVTQRAQQQVAAKKAEAEDDKGGLFGRFGRKK